MRQGEVINKLLEKASEGTTRNGVFDNGWLDIEDIYREVGWIVTYDKPGYNETYEATFEFKKDPKKFDV